jgi:uncharacterized membrane protein (UPF0127 family)
MAEPDIVRIHNRTQPTTPPLLADRCSSFTCRLRGLTFRKDLAPERGLLLVQRRENRRDAAIHMLWMKFDIAVIWIDSRGVVVDVRPAYRWRSFLTPDRAARFVLETRLEYLDRYQIGDEVFFEQIIDNQPGAGPAFTGDSR